MSTSQTPYQRHMRWFAEPRSPHRITVLSALKGGLGIGLDFPVALSLALGLRIMVSPFPFLSPGTLDDLSGWKARSQLDGMSLDKRKEYSFGDLIRLYDTTRSTRPPRRLLTRLIDKAHVGSLWVFGADRQTLEVSNEDLEKFQRGDWAESMAIRRRVRTENDSNVLPFWRGGPISTTGHSWFVDKLFGVQVYQKR